MIRLCQTWLHELQGLTKNGYHGFPDAVGSMLNFLVTDLYARKHHLLARGADVPETLKFRVYVVNALDQSLVKALIQGHALPTAPSSQHGADR